ncbi:MAG: helix-turn-helix transcriptional regulator [Magnetococcales bacterium]|nr:helix-turn-helix transcriptional regulator [Magnetococcales bacterium]
MLDVYTIRKENLLYLLEERWGGVKKAMGDAIEMSPSLFHAYTAEKPIGPKMARRIEVAAELPHGWMDHTHGKREGFEEIDVVTVPVFDVEASAGHGSLVESEEKSKELFFRYDWITERGFHQSHLGIIRVKGQSMEPTIPNGAVILVNREDTEIKNGRIYVLRYDDMLHVKRLQRLPGSLVQVISDNAAEYPPFVVDINSSVEFQVLGRVVWLGREL